jgi:hypothetical protein
MSAPGLMSRRRERGLVLVYVSVLGFLMLMVWTLSYRATLDTIRVERSLVLRSTHDASVTRAAAVALELLETDLPPTEIYTCIVTITDGSDVYACLVEYSPVIYPTSWDVDVRLATADEIATYPAAPSSF